MAAMQFLPELKKFLKSNGKIYTVRKYKYPPNSLVLVLGVGKCRRTLVASDVSKEYLNNYYHYSGFSSTSDWWSKIVQFIPNSEYIKYLYKVEVVNG